jgi:hypothetical protein
MEKSIFVDVLLSIFLYFDRAASTDPLDYVPLPAGATLFCSYLQHTTGSRPMTTSFPATSN